MPKMRSSTIIIILILHILIKNVPCKGDQQNGGHQESLFKDDGQESRISVLSLPMAKEVVNLLSMHRNGPNLQAQLQSHLNRIALPQQQQHQQPTVASPTRQTPFGNLPQQTRPSPSIHVSPTRFNGPQFVNNQIDFDQNEDLFGTVSKDPSDDQWPLSSPETPKIVHLDVKCEKNLMKVSIEFDKVFNGVIFSKGHYNYRNCLYLPPNTGRKNVVFDISINSCGTTGNAQGTFYNEDVTADSGQFFENTVVIQYDPQVQEAWDQARKLRCTWHDSYEKSVSFRPFPVDMLDVVRADFAGDNVGCWMQIQVGKGPWASEVAGIVKIGQTMTMVLAIKDEENKFDMLVRNCIAHDGKRAPIELVDGNGCIVRSKLMTKFTKIRNFGSSASVLSYTHFQAFKFPDSMEVHFQCTIQICRYQCPEQCTQQSGSDVINLYNEGDGRKKRDITEHVVVGKMNPTNDGGEVGLNKAIQVVSQRDLSFSIENNDQQSQNEALVSKSRSELDGNSICIPTYGIAVSLLIVCLLCMLVAIVTIGLVKKIANCRNKTKQMPNKMEQKTYPHHQPHHHHHPYTAKSTLPNLYEMIRVN